MLTNKDIDDYDADSVEDYELYDNCESFLEGNNPTEKELYMIRSYLLQSLYNEKHYFKQILFHYIATLCGFIIDPKLYTQKVISNEKWKIHSYRQELIDCINWYKKSKILSRYILDDNEFIANTIQNSFNDMLCITTHKVDIKEYTLEYVLSDEFLEYYFDSISNYNDLYSNISETIKKGIWYE